jgi:hypothetical protein
MKANKAPANKTLAVITCECGKELLLLPDLKAMAQAIDAHICEHIQKIDDPAQAASESNRLWDTLIASIFSVVDQKETPICY